MHRRHLLLAGIATVPTAALATVPRARNRTAKPRRPWRWKTVTRSFTSNDLILIPFTTIPDPSEQGRATPYPATIQVRGLRNGRIRNVSVRFSGFSHVFPADVDMWLVAPNGRGAILMSDAGGVNDVSGITFTLHDGAASPVPEPLVSGTFRPTNIAQGNPDIFPAPAPKGIFHSDLSVFKGGNPNGVWRLFVVDNLPRFDSGSVERWSLRITARIKVRVKRRRTRKRRS